MSQKCVPGFRVGNMGKNVNAFRQLRTGWLQSLCILAWLCTLASCEATGGGKFFNNKAMDTVVTDSFGSFEALREFRSLMYRPDCSLLVLKENYREERIPVTFLWHNDAYFDKDDIRVFLRPLPASSVLAQ
jgi:hypothetical protein